MKRIAMALCALTIGLSIVSYLGAIVPGAVLWFAIPLFVVLYLVALRTARMSTVPALVVSAFILTIWAVAVNGLSGETMGPAARSTFAVGIGAAIALVGARRFNSWQFTLGMLTIYASSLYLGSATETFALTPLIAVTSVASIAFIHLARDQIPVDKSVVGSFALVACLGVIAIMIGLRFQQEVFLRGTQDRPLVASYLAEGSVYPPWLNEETKLQMSPTATIIGGSEIRPSVKSPIEANLLSTWAVVLVYSVSALIVLVFAYISINYLRLRRTWSRSIVSPIDVRTRTIWFWFCWRMTRLERHGVITDPRAFQSDIRLTQLAKSRDVNIEALIATLERGIFAQRSQITKSNIDWSCDSLRKMFDSYYASIPWWRKLLDFIKPVSGFQIQ